MQNGAFSRGSKSLEKRQVPTNRAQIQPNFPRKVAPAIQEFPDFDGCKVSELTTRVSSSRRQSTEPQFQGQADAQKTEARTFRSLGQPRTRHLLLSTLVVCTLLVLLVGVSHAANEVLLRFTCNFSDSREQALAVCPELAGLLFFPRFPISMGRA